MDDLSGKIIKGYELIEMLGKGGQAQVYRARQTDPEREVAIKIILPDSANDPEFIRRFESEANFIATLEHPYIVPLYDFWREPGRAYIIMRYLRGGNLQQAIEQGPLGFDQITQWLEQIARALDYAHRKGVIHRDLKPVNLLLDEEGNIYLSDFGIAKKISGEIAPLQSDTQIGTPIYAAPEQIQGGTVSPQTDIYTLGVVLYEMLTGENPFSKGRLHRLLFNEVDPVPALEHKKPDVPPALNAVIQRATAIAPEDRYPDAFTLVADFKRALQLQDSADTEPVILLEEDAELTNPYKGLYAFDETDAATFFGREKLVQKLLTRMTETGEYARFLAVIGPSGSGKSSVVKAGLLPALRQGALPGSENWFIAKMTPSVHPLEELELALLRIAIKEPPSLLAQLKEDARGLLRAARRIMPDGGELLLVVDQFEEVFTLSEKEEAEHFLKGLFSAVTDPHSPIRVVITLRADFYDRPLMHPYFGKLIVERQESITVMTPEELHAAIQKPASRMGITLELGLVEIIAADIFEQPGALPLLQYALTELFEHRQGQRLTREAYQQIGGVRGALGRRAEEIFSSLDEKSHDTAKQLFLRLITLGEGTEDTRRRTSRAELEALVIYNPQSEIGHIINTFGQARLLSFDRDPQTRSPTVEVAHEALLREWMRLREWLEKNRDDLRQQRALRSAKEEWEAVKRDPGYLLRGGRLARFKEWADGTDVKLTSDERVFLEASITERNARRKAEEVTRQRELEQARKHAEKQQKMVEELFLVTHSLELRNRMISAFGIIAIFTAIIALYFANQAQRQTELARMVSLAVPAMAQSYQQPDLAILLNIEFFKKFDPYNISIDLPQPDIHREGSIIYSMDFNADGTILAIGGCRKDSDYGLCSQGEVQLWDVERVHLLWEQSIKNTVYILSVAFSADGKMLASGGCGKQDFDGVCIQGEIQLWDVDYGQQIGEPLTDEGAVNSVSFNPEGSLLASGGDNKTIRLWNTRTREFKSLIGHADAVNSIAFSPDGLLLASASADETIRLWDIEKSNRIETLTSEQTNMQMGNVQSVAFNPDGTILAGGSKNGNIILWNLTKLESTGLQEPFEMLFVDIESVAPVYSVDFSLDGTILVSGNGDDVIRLWDVANKQLLGEAPGNLENINYVIFSPDNLTLVSAGEDGIVEVWTITKLWIAQACQRAGRNLSEAEWNQYLYWKGPYDPEYKTCPQWP